MIDQQSFAVVRHVHRIDPFVERGPGRHVGLLGQLIKVIPFPAALVRFYHGQELLGPHPVVGLNFPLSQRQMLAFQLIGVGHLAGRLSV